MRRTLTSTLTGLALLVATLTLVGYVVDVVVFAPGRPAQVAAQMLSTKQGRQVVTDDLAQRVHAYAPAIPQEQAHAVIDQALQDPRVVQALHDLSQQSTAEAQRAAIDRFVGSVAAQDPQAAAIARQYVNTVKPTQVLSGPSSPLSGATARSWHRFLTKAVPVGALVALVLAGAALLLGPRRDAVLRRIGIWGVVWAVIGLALWFALPRFVLPHLTGTWPVVLSAALTASRSDLVSVFGGLAAAGAVLLLLGYGARGSSTSYR